MIAVFLCFLIAKIYELTLHHVVMSFHLGDAAAIIGTIILMILFAFSYRKQTDYVRKRVNKVLKMKKEKS